MKRKNTPAHVSSEESSSEDDEQLKEDELQSEEEESQVEEDEADENEDEADENEGEEALDASATDSDEDGSDVDSDLEDNKEEVKPTKSKSEKIKEHILQRYHDRQGKQLYIRFPHKVPETQEELEEKIKEIAPLVVKVHKPRQRHVRFCLVDFASKEERDDTLKKIQKGIKKGGPLEGYVANIPRTESSDFVTDLVERKLKSVENKKARRRLKKESKKSLQENNFTSTVIILNLPQTSTEVQIRELFPNAVDINVKPCKGKKYKDKSIAAITLPTTMDARNAIKKKLSLGGNELIIKFDNQKLKKKQNTLKGKKNVETVEAKKEEQISEDSGPKAKKAKVEPTTKTNKDVAANKDPKQKNNKANKGPKPKNKFNKNNANKKGGNKNNFKNRKNGKK